MAATLRPVSVAGDQLASRAERALCGKRYPPINAPSSGLPSVRGRHRARPRRGATNQKRQEVLEEVVVTAEWRQVYMLNVPVAVTAISAEKAATAAVTSVTDLQAMAPSVYWGTGAGGGSVAVRGISGTGSTGEEPANAVYVDGVYQPFSAWLLFSFKNIESIEIDKGSRDSSYTPGGDFSLGCANYDTVSARAYLSGGIGDTPAADVSVFYMKQRDGWRVNAFMSSKNYLGDTLGVRNKLLWMPDDATRVMLTIPTTICSRPRRPAQRRSCRTKTSTIRGY